MTDNACKMEISCDLLKGAMPFMIVLDQEMTVTWASPSVLLRFEDAVGRNATELVSFNLPRQEITADSIRASAGRFRKLLLLDGDPPSPLAGQWLVTSNPPGKKGNKTPCFALLALPDVSERELLELGLFTFADFPHDGALVDLLVNQDESTLSRERGKVAIESLMDKNSEVQSILKRMERAGATIEKGPERKTGLIRPRYMRAESQARESVKETVAAPPAEQAPADVTKLPDLPGTGLLFIDPSGSIIEVNRTFCEITGFATAEVVGNSCDILNVEPCGSDLSLPQPDGGGVVFENLYRITGRDGRRLTILRNTDTICDASGSVLGEMKSFVDVTGLVVHFEKAGMAAQQAQAAIADEVRAEKATALAGVEEARAEAESARTDAESARADAEQVEHELEENRNAAAQAAAELEETRNAAAQAAAELEEARAVASRAETELQEAHSRTEQTRTELDEARVLAEQAEAAAEQARVEAEQARDEAEQARDEAEQARTEAEQARTEVVRARAVAAKSREGMDEVNAAADLSLVELEEARSAADQARAAADQARTEADEARAIADEARAEADEARAAADEARTEADQARAEADEARAEADEARAAVDEARAEADEARAAADQARTEVEEARAAANQAHVEVDEARAAGRALADAARAESATARQDGDALVAREEELRRSMIEISEVTDLLLHSDLHAEQREHIEMIRSSADALGSCLGGILDRSAIVAGGAISPAPEEFYLHECLERAVVSIEPTANSKNLEIGLAIAPELPERLVGDTKRLRQVVYTLTDNAVRYTETGNISIRAAADEVTEQSVGFHLTVADTGPGIDAERAGTIFDIAATPAGGDGHGSSLAVASHLASVMGGRLWVESDPDKGSVFHFTAQLKPGRVKRIEKPEPAAKASTPPAAPAVAAAPAAKAAKAAKAAPPAEPAPAARVMPPAEPAPAVKAAPRKAVAPRPAQSRPAGTGEPGVPAVEDTLKRISRRPAWASVAPGDDEPVRSAKKRAPAAPKEPAAPPTDEELIAPIQTAAPKTTIRQKPVRTKLAPDPTAGAAPSKPVTPTQQTEPPQQEPVPPTQQTEPPQQEPVTPTQPTEPPQQEPVPPTQQAEPPQQEPVTPAQQAEPPQQEPVTPAQQAEPSQQEQAAPPQQAVPAEPAAAPVPAEPVAEAPPAEQVPEATPPAPALTRRRPKRTAEPVRRAPVEAIDPDDLIDDDVDDDDPLYNLSVLVVDDNRKNRKELKAMLRSWDMKPTVVNGGRAALAALWRAYETGKPYSLILLDAEMPEMDGFMIAEKIQRNQEISGARLILLTSDDQLVDAQRCRELGISGCLWMPVKPKTLLNKIQQVMDEEFDGEETAAFSNDVDAVGTGREE